MDPTKYHQPRPVKRTLTLCVTERLTHCIQGYLKCSVLREQSCCCDPQRSAPDEPPRSRWTLHSTECLEKKGSTTCGACAVTSAVRAAGHSACPHMFLHLLYVVHVPRPRRVLHSFMHAFMHSRIHSLIHFISFHFISFHFISFHFISFHFISFHFISFHFISFHFISFHFISFHFISFHFNSIQFISIQFNSIQFNSIHIPPWVESQGGCSQCVCVCVLVHVVSFSRVGLRRV